MSVGNATSTKIYTSFDDLPEAYRLLGASAESRSFDLGRDWFELFERAIGRTCGRLRLYGVETLEGRPVLLLPLWEHTGSGWLQPRVLGSLANYYTTLWSAWVAKGVRAEDVARTIRHALGDDGARWDLLQIGPCEPEFVTARALPIALKGLGMAVGDRVDTANWYAPVSGMSYKEFIGERSSKLRNTLHRRTRKLEREHSVQFRLVTGGDGAELDASLAEYERVYTLRWKRGEAFPEFIRGLARLCAVRGWLRLGLLELEMQVVAVQFWLVDHGRASIFKLAHDPAFEHMSVGTVLSGYMYKHVLDVDRVDIIDYLTGDDAYKSEWMTHRRVRQTWLVANGRRPKGRLLGLRWRAAQIAGHVIHPPRPAGAG